MPYLGNEVAPLVQALEGKELKLDSDGDSSITADTDDQIDFKTGGSDRATIDATGNVGINSTTPSTYVDGSDGQTLVLESAGTERGAIVFASEATGGEGEIIGLINFTDTANSTTNKRGAAIRGIRGSSDTNPFLTFTTANSERMRIDSSGNLLVGKTSQGLANSGVELREGSASGFTRDNTVMDLNRTGSDGQIMRFRKDVSTVGDIRCLAANLHIQGTTSGLSFQGNNVITPVQNGARTDNAIDLGDSSRRFDDIHATNGTIQTSDQNEKQDIATATTKELNVAKKLSALFKTFRWKDKVAEKGDKARTHTGIVAQEVQTAFKAEGLDASNYGLFTSDTWWEKEIKVDAVKADEEKGIEAEDAYTYMDTKDKKTDGYTERTRLGVRYPELFSFIFSSIEARLTALESK